MSPKQTSVTPLAMEIARIVIAELQDRGPVLRRLLDIEEAAIYLGLSEESIRHKAAAGEIPVTRFDRRLRFDMVELDRWIREHTRFE